MDAFNYRPASPTVWTMESDWAGLLGVYLDREVAKAAAETLAGHRLIWSPSILDPAGEMALHDDSTPMTADIYLVSPRRVGQHPDQLELRYTDDHEALGKIYRLLIVAMRGLDATQDGGPQLSRSSERSWPHRVWNMPSRSMRR